MASQHLSPSASITARDSLSPCADLAWSVLISLLRVLSTIVPHTLSVHLLTYKSHSSLAAVCDLIISFFLSTCLSIDFFLFFFFFNDPAPPEIYPLPLHAALPILDHRLRRLPDRDRRDHLIGQGVDGDQPVVVLQSHVDPGPVARFPHPMGQPPDRDRRHLGRSEEHTSELQSQSNLVCRLLLEKKK